MHKRGTATQRVADTIRNMIIAGELQPGDPLRQSKLARDIGTSRVPIREALHLLESEGLVTFTSNRGATVSRRSADELQQYHEMRARLETWLLELSIPLMTEQHFSKAEQLQKDMENCTGEEWSRLNLEFHCTLYEAAGRDLILKNVRKLYHNSYGRFQFPILGSRNIAKSLREHAELLELCRQRQVQKAVDLLESHIIVHGHRVIDHIRSLENPG